MSRLGKKVIAVPKEVKVEVKDNTIFIEGPKGKLSRVLSPRISLDIKEGEILVKRLADTKMDKSLHGLYRALIVNMIKGVTEGYKKELEIIGVGFKAAVQGSSLNLNLGFSHPVNFAIPQGIKIEAPKPTQLVITGIDKELIGKVSTEIRSIYPPEPYKGKGVRFLGEHVKKKVGKAQATGGGK
ncbi:MAG: 50S ribosomal protein L6 [Candidatus Omnitrophica bacterium]|jgi:large subunit ribosomal protein L6|nr:50S ribosomal protein L6 [Candidatus Omnitrophota bacterium]MDD3988451.1 50S ribosomal protein L6 [Candidatus Omnitrophota bacterium]MDD4981643.1 50S ribosomal protein L6 [Candidatus Omnitrophota bacterium]MDD5664904.1 50S ribosomal protein L6 [Candidatus Omnitrophota bacterium]